MTASELRDRLAVLMQKTGGDPTIMIRDGLSLEPVSGLSYQAENRLVDVGEPALQLVRVGAVIVIE